MRTLMKNLTLAIVISLLPTYSLADEIDDQINKACLRHAISLVGKLKNNVIDDMSDSQSDEALVVATESCQAYFKSEFSRNSDAVAAKTEEKKDEDERGWFSRMILSEQTEKKDGHKRLERK